LVLLAGVLVRPALAQSTRADTDAVQPGVLWQGSSPDLSLRDIATLAAPILWYSRDEPLLFTDNPIVPEAHPCDVASTTPVVYFQVVEIKLRGDESVTLPEEDDPRFFEKVEHFVLKYFFYYREDWGVGGHPHDLEAAEFEIYLDEIDDGHQVRLESVTALAHGSRWYSNILHIEPDTALPLTLFVEEGKHATGPDRNADGHYTPGYDVNRRINDAWGIRDTLGSGVLLTAAYSSAMTKPREFEYRMLPPDTSLLQVGPRNSSLSRSEDHLGRYELRRANRVSQCEEVPVERARLVSMMNDHGFGVEQEPTQYDPNDVRDALRRLRQPGGSWVPSISLRHERRLGVSLIFLGTDVGVGWIAAKVNANETSASLGGLFTPSASRFADYYVAGGVNRIFTTTSFDAEVETEEGRVGVTFSVPPRWDPYMEVGVRFRVKVSDRARWFLLGHSFGGVRLGIRTLGFSDFFDTRFVVEVGAGAW
jgi:hypothetical protein